MCLNQILMYLELYLRVNLVIRAKSCSPEQIDSPPFWPPYWKLGYKAWRNCTIKVPSLYDIRSQKLKSEQFWCSENTFRYVKKWIRFHRLPWKNGAAFKEWLAGNKITNLPKLSRTRLFWREVLLTLLLRQTSPAEILAKKALETVRDLCRNPICYLFTSFFQRTSTFTL